MRRKMVVIDEAYCARPPTRLARRAARHFGCMPEQVFFGIGNDVLTRGRPGGPGKLLRGWFFRLRGLDYFHASTFAEWQGGPSWATKRLLGRDAFCWTALTKDLSS